MLLPLRLPRIAAPHVSDCCPVLSEGELALNSSLLQEVFSHLEEHVFSIEALAWSIQNGINSESLESFLHTHEATSLGSGLKRTISAKMKSKSSQIPILFFAAEANNPAIIRILCDAGADPNCLLEPQNLPLTAYVVLSAEYDLMDHSECLIALLVKGADSTSIPKDMWISPLERPKREVDPKSNDITGLYLWCEEETREALCRTLDLTQRYALLRNFEMLKRSPADKQITDHWEMQPLLEVPYYLIGQIEATTAVVEHVLNHTSYRRSEPLVILLTGLSGHGKTELAMSMGRLLGVELQTIDCTSMKFETDLFGPVAPYRGYETGSVLNNFLANQSGERAVVFLDEFDKTGNDVRKSLLLPFDSGHYIDRRNHKLLDLQNIIWILAANSAADIILKFWNAYMRDEPSSSERERLYRRLQRDVRVHVINEFEAPLVGRISEIVPFTPFTELEKAVVAFKFMRESKKSLREAIDISSGKFLGHSYIDYVDDGKLAGNIALHYMPELGARSLQQAVRRDIEGPLRKCATHESEEVTDDINDGLLQGYQVRLLGNDGRHGAEIAVEKCRGKEILLKRRNLES